MFMKSSNFCIVVKIIPFTLILSNRFFKCSLLVAWTGVCLKKSLHLENCENNWSSKSFLSVKTTIVGDSKAFCNKATFIGFTGTPISAKDKSTIEVFGNYIDVYDMTQAVEDGATRIQSGRFSNIFL